MTLWNVSFSKKFLLKSGQIKKIKVLYYVIQHLNTNSIQQGYSTQLVKKMPLFFWFNQFLDSRAEILEIISLVFWKKLSFHEDIIKLTDL